MNTSELLVLIFAFIVGYTLFKCGGCTEGIDDDDDDDDGFLYELNIMNNLITEHINKCNNTLKIDCHILDPPTVTGGCDKGAIGILIAQARKLVDSGLREGEGES